MLAGLSGNKRILGLNWLGIIAVFIYFIVFAGFFLINTTPHASKFFVASEDPSNGVIGRFIAESYRSSGPVDKTQYTEMLDKIAKISFLANIILLYFVFSRIFTIQISIKKKLLSLLTAMFIWGTIVFILVIYSVGPHSGTIIHPFQFGTLGLGIATTMLNVGLLYWFFCKTLQSKVLWKRIILFTLAFIVMSSFYLWLQYEKYSDLYIHYQGQGAVCLSC